MKTVPVILAATALLLFFTGCHHSNPSVVGDWTLKTVQGTVVTPTQPEYVTSYNSSNPIFYVTTIPSDSLDSTATPYLCDLNIKSDGTYTITETYTVFGRPGQVRSYSNYWQYLTDNPGGATFFLNGIINTSGQAPFLFSIFTNSPLFQVSQLTDNSLQLTDTWSNTSTVNVASGQTNSYVMTFAK